jgi:hypothetical protein
MTHTLTISGLDDFEATHIAEILNRYEGKMLEAKIDALCAKDEGRVEWIIDHLDWHKSIMAKIQWTKETE